MERVRERGVEGGKGMIAIAWYNVVAIIVGILLLVWVGKIGDDDIFGVETAFATLVGIVFFAIWGGLFWW